MPILAVEFEAPHDPFCNARGTYAKFLHERETLIPAPHGGVLWQDPAR
jgi:hypothetical protein